MGEDLDLATTSEPNIAAGVDFFSRTYAQQEEVIEGILRDGQVATLGGIGCGMRSKAFTEQSPSTFQNGRLTLIRFEQTIIPELTEKRTFSEAQSK
jgi:hypothetical protein